MGYSVKERADRVGTFRWIAVQAMETLARWIPTTPELEAKVLFGRHVWDFAQHADAFGKRAFELRAPLQHSLAASAPYRKFIEEVAGLEATPDRIAAFYATWLPGIEARYRRYLGTTDTLMDEPTVRILERALFDFPRMQAERERLVGAIGLATPGIAAAQWREREAGADELAVAA